MQRQGLFAVFALGELCGEGDEGARVFEDR